MFLHLSVILFTAGGSLSRIGGFCPGDLCPGGLCPGGSLSREGLCQVTPLPLYGYVRAIRILLECILVIYLTMIIVKVTAMYFLLNKYFWIFVERFLKDH